MTRLRGIAEIALQSDHNVGLLQEALSDCVEESGRMLTMLDTLMDISEAETGTMKLNLKKMDIGDVLREAVDLYSYVAEEKEIAIYVDIPEGLYLSGDRNRLRQVLSNLLDNALKYTPERGKIDIRAFRESDQVVVTVKDSGIGILPEEIPRVWDRLYRGDKSRSQRGLGLGLSMVKAIVQAHKGSVEVSSRPGEGSLFTIRLRTEL